jgi:hypothetical protein
VIDLQGHRREVVWGERQPGKKLCSPRKKAGEANDAQRNDPDTGREI